MPWLNAQVIFIIDKHTLINNCVNITKDIVYQSVYLMYTSTTDVIIIKNQFYWLKDNHMT